MLLSLSRLIMQVYHDRDNFMQDTKNEEKLQAKEGGMQHTAEKKKRCRPLSFLFFLYCSY